jgi:dynactin-4
VESCCSISTDSSPQLSAQLQKYEDSAPDSLEFERLKEHFEPFLRASSLSSSVSGHAAHPGSAAHSHHLHSTSIAAAASAALARDIPGVGKYNPISRTASGRAHRDRTANKDEMPEYKSRVEIASVGHGGRSGDGEVEYMRRLRQVQNVARLEQRWGNSWAGSLQIKSVLFLAIPQLTEPEAEI